MMVPVQQTPGYHEGFDDAQIGEPLFDDAAPEYRASWQAYWHARDILEEIRIAQ